MPSHLKFPTPLCNVLHSHLSSIVTMACGGSLHPTAAAVWGSANQTFAHQIKSSIHLPHCWHHSRTEQGCPYPPLQNVGVAPSRPPITTERKLDCEESSQSNFISVFIHGFDQNPALRKRVYGHHWCKRKGQTGGPITGTFTKIWGRGETHHNL